MPIFLSRIWVTFDRQTQWILSALMLPLISQSLIAFLAITMFMISLSCCLCLCTDCCFDTNATVVHMTKLILNQHMACWCVFLFVPQDQFCAIYTSHSFDSSPFLLALNSSIHSVLVTSLHATTSLAFTKFIHLSIIGAVYKKIKICLLSSYKLLSWSTSPDQEAHCDLPPTLALVFSPYLAQTSFR